MLAEVCCRVRLGGICGVYSGPIQDAVTTSHVPRLSLILNTELIIEAIREYCGVAALLSSCIHHVSLMRILRIVNRDSIMPDITSKVSRFLL